MKDKYFIDTNIFIYSFDPAEERKSEIAKVLISESLKTGMGCISFQVIQEFLNVATTKFEKPLTVVDCKIYLNKVLFPLCVVYPDNSLYENTLDVQAATVYSFYDSMVLAAAVKSGCTILYSEDMQDGHHIQSVTIKNPF